LVRLLDADTHLPQGGGHERCVLALERPGQPARAARQPRYQQRAIGDRLAARGRDAPDERPVRRDDGERRRGHEAQVARQPFARKSRAPSSQSLNEKKLFATYKRDETGLRHPISGAGRPLPEPYFMGMTASYAATPPARGSAAHVRLRGVAGIRPSFAALLPTHLTPKPT